MLKSKSNSKDNSIKKKRRITIMKTFKGQDSVVKYNLEELKIQDCRTKGQEVLECKSKSELFRNMYDFGMDVCDIAKECGSHYSFVYGVISSTREVRKVVKVSKSDKIREMYDAGKTPGEIAKEMEANYSFVFSVVKKYKDSKLEKEA